jgi:PhnB protein
MKSLNPYINFSGQCREALEFYKKCFNGKIETISTFEEAPGATDEKYKQNIMHSEFRAEGIFFMATDGMPGQNAVSGDCISLTIQLTDEQEQARIFDALSQGGKITQPLEDTFWGAKFGMLVDRYGINWMLNCSKSENAI